MKAKPYIVVTPMGVRWLARFSTEQAAWRRIITPAKRKDESDEAARLRLTNAGFKVKYEPEN